MLLEYSCFRVMISTRHVISLKESKLEISTNSNFNNKFMYIAIVLYNPNHDGQNNSKA